ncbi:MAG: hypothetical protein HUU01_09605 [Saprospiraceae bacterium]|nr:hypothetical protein [Saprospiraceae bacterium]
MSSSISLATSLNTAIHVDGSGQKTEASLIGNKIAKFTYSSSDIQLTEETSVPAGTTQVLDGTDFHWTVSYRPSTHTVWIVGTSDSDMGLGIKVYPIDMDDNDFYLQKDSSGDLVLTLV